MELQPRDAASGEGIMSPEQLVGSLSETILDKFGEKKFDVEDIARSLEEAGPYQNVFMQVNLLICIHAKYVPRSFVWIHTGMKILWCQQRYRL